MFFSQQEIENQIKSEISSFNIKHRNLVHRNPGKISDFYMFTKLIGKGGIAEVKLAVHKSTGISRAIKILNKYHLSDRQIRQSIKEIEILAQLDHPNIAQIHEFFEDERFIYVIEDLYTGGELVDKIINDDDEDGLSEQKTAKIMKQVFSGLAYCHRNNIAYRDLKPENIMLTHNSYDNLKLVDFGLSYHFKKGELMTEKVGTPFYVAPEILNGAHTEKCDLWSAGVLMFLLLVGYPPFDGESDSEIFFNIRQGQFSMQDCAWDDISEEAKDLITKLLQSDYNQRISAMEALDHKWIKMNCEQSKVDQKLLENSLKNLKSFNKGNRLQEAIFSFIVDNIITRKEKQDLQKCYQALDMNGDGVISRDELKQAYEKIILHEGHEKDDIEYIFERLDQNFDEQIEFSDFLNATVQQKKLLTRENLESAFKLFDSDGDGKLSIQDIKNIFSGCGRILHQETWEALIKDMDHNDLNYISQQDFFEAMQNHIHQCDYIEQKGISHTKQIKENVNTIFQVLLNQQDVEGEQQTQN